MAFCAASLYLVVGVFGVLSLLFQALTLRYTNASAQQFLTVQLVFVVSFVVSLSLLYNAFSGVCG